MRRYPYRSAILLFILSAIVISAGCTATTIGDVTYSGKNLTAIITSSVPPSDTYIQVTVYRISGIGQEEYSVISTPVSLHEGTNAVTIPADLGPGNYKLYVYLIRNGERSSAVIRDIGV